MVKRTLGNNAATLVFVHNHTSGDLNTSQDNLFITKKLKEAVTAIDVSAHDHLIVAGNDVYSFSDHGIL